MFKHWKRTAMILSAALAAGLMFAGLSLAGKGGKPKPPPEAPVKYNMTLLPLLEGSTSCYLGGMNNLGDAVGYPAWLYTPETGTVDLNDTDLFPVPDGWDIQDANDINDSGQIVGGAYFADADGQIRLHAFRYTPGEGFIAMGSLPGLPHSDATAINSRGDVVGYLESDGATFNLGFVWTEENGLQGLSDDQYDTYAALDINDSGEVAGTMVVNGDARAFRYIPGDGPDSGIHDLGVLGRSKPGDLWSNGYGINNSGQVVGGSTAKRAWFERAYRYTDGDGMENLGTIDNSQWSWSRGSAINSQGQVVGPSSISTGGTYIDQENRTFLYTDANGMLDLWSLIENPPPGMTATDVDVYGMTINDGVILPGGGLSSFGQIGGTIQGTAFLLTPDR